MAKINIAVIVGSNRRESINRKLAQALGGLVPAQLAFNFVQIDDLPLYNQDHENDPPASVVRFKAEIAAADGLLFVTPEHSRSIPAVLKNAIDWGARPWGHNSWTDKVAAITGTSPGAIGTAVAQQHLRQILAAQGVRGLHHLQARIDRRGGSDRGRQHARVSPGVCRSLRHAGEAARGAGGGEAARRRGVSAR
jgi:chromate reductase, NAD(P)H dehydrogenase (quinone)